MGKVRNQGIWSAIWSYGGMLLGFYFTTFLFPEHFSEAEIGLRTVLSEIALIFGKLCVAGMSASYLKFFPILEHRQTKDYGLGFLVLVIPLAAFAFLTVLGLVFEEPVLNYFAAKAPLLRDYYHLVFPFALIWIYLSVFDALARSRFHVIYSIFNRQLLVRVLLIGTVFLVLLMPDLRAHYWTLYVAAWGLTLLSLVAYVIIRIPVRIGYHSRVWKRRFFSQITRFGSYNVLTNLSAQLILRIDILMLTKYLGLEAAGIYGMSVYLVSLVDQAKRVMSTISVPYLSRYWKDRDLDAISKLFREVGINQLVAGTGMFLLIWTNIDSFYAIIAKGEFFAAGKWAFFILGLTKLTDMAFSCNSEVIAYSKHFRMNLYFQLVMLVLVTSTNALLIPPYGLEGAALASLITYLAFNLLKFGFLYQRFRLSPFQWRMMLVITIAAGVGFLTTLWSLENKWLDIALRSVLVATLYGGTVLVLGISTQLNDLVAKSWKRFLG